LTKPKPIDFDHPGVLLENKERAAALYKAIDCLSDNQKTAFILSFIEVAVIVHAGLDRMYNKREDVFYYLTVHNQNYSMPAMKSGVEEGILKGLYKFSEKPAKEKGKRKARIKAHIFGSGALMPDALRAQEILEEKYDIAADVWSATSYNELYRDAIAAERWNLLNPSKKAKVPYITELLEKEEGPFVAVSDYLKQLPNQLDKWVPGGIYALGTDGYGRSETREALRRFFEVDAEFIVLAVLTQLAKRGDIPKATVNKAIKELGIDIDKPNPLKS
ncbi:MAG: hypothetical protein AAFP70_08350, partial [Calditrichota bacterium]